MPGLLTWSRSFSGHAVRDFIGQHSIAEQAKDDHDQETCAICTIIESAALKMRPEKRSWCSRIAQPGQSTNLLGQRRTALVFALDQFNLPGKRYSFAHAKTARRPSCCGCVAWEVRTPPCHAPRERVGEMQGPIRNQNGRPQIFLDDDTGARSIAAAQRASTDAWLEAWLARFLQVLREIGKRAPPDQTGPSFRRHGSKL